MARGPYGLPNCLEGEMKCQRNIPVGYPLPNYSLYVLDEMMKPVPVGIQGEVYIGGSGVAKGYLNDEKLTAERFVPNIFASRGELDCDWDTLQRTGDLDRWTSSGSLLIEGRVAGDTQVKVRGLRIDLCEVEAAIIAASASALSQAIVSTRGEPLQDGLFLVVHIVFLPEYPPDQRVRVMEILPSQLDLPYYMIPASFIQVDALPYTNSHKIDRIAISNLPLTQRPELRTIGLTGTAARVVELWNELIPAHAANNGSTIGPHVDFFHIGGTSLLLLKLRTRIYAYFGVEIRLADLFNNSTVKGMAVLIGQKNGRESPVNEAIDWEAETRPLGTIPPAPTLHFPDIQIPPKVIVLTAATGYLGRALLHAFIEEAHIEKIHCVGIRKIEDHRHTLSFKRAKLNVL